MGLMAVLMVVAGWFMTAVGVSYDPGMLVPGLVALAAGYIGMDISRKAAGNA